MAKKLDARRSVRINFNDGTDPVDLELVAAAAIKTEQQCIHIDQMKDGKFRLIYNSNLIPDFTKVKDLEIIRE